MNYGRATLNYVSGSKSPPCDNCGDKTATMYQLELAKGVGEDSHLSWVLCVTCRSHLENLFLKHDEAYKDCY